MYGLDLPTYHLKKQKTTIHDNRPMDGIGFTMFSNLLTWQV